MNNIKHLELQYKQAVEEIELYSNLVDELRNEISNLKSKNMLCIVEGNFISEDERYLNNYPDVIKTGMSAREHYDKYGKFLGRRWS